MASRLDPDRADGEGTTSGGSEEHVRDPTTRGGPATSPALRFTAVPTFLGTGLRSRGFGAFAGLLVLAGVFQAMSGLFFTPGQLRGLSLVASAVGIVGVGVAFLMISGEFDLSVSAMYAFVPIVLGKILIFWDLNEWVAFAVVMALAASIGVVHGLIRTRLNVPSFITTLATLFILGGVSFFITGGLPVPYFHATPLTTMLGSNIPGTPFAAPFAWMLLFGLVFWVILGFTRYGNWTSAAGAQGGVGRALGVPVRLVKTINFAICSVLAGFAGCTAFAQLGSVDPNFGTEINLLAIVAAVLGGTSLFGVQGSIAGTVFGALLLGSLATGLVLVGAPGSWYTSLIGVTLLLAVLLNGQLDRFNVHLSRRTRSR